MKHDEHEEDGKSEAEEPDIDEDDGEVAWLFEKQWGNKVSE